MNAWPQQTVVLFKLCLCILPLLAGCFIAEAFAFKQKKQHAERFWFYLSILFISVLAVCILGGLLIWAMD